jgi:type VI secretion system protein ImpE
MSAAELFKAGKLPEAIAAQVQAVKETPADQAKRVFLFELLALSGDLDRARRQIEAVEYEEPEREMATAAYRKLLDAEQARRQLFSTGLAPKFLANPPEHFQLRLEAVSRLREGRAAEARAVLDQANALVPALHGQLNGKPFEGLRDGDDLFAFVLEVMSQGSYYWVPLEQVVSLAMNPPRFLRDQLWAPAVLEVRDGPTGDVFLPVFYPNSHEHPDLEIRLGRRNDWLTSEGAPVRGAGPRTFLVGDDAVDLLEWRQLEMA